MIIYRNINGVKTIIHNIEVDAQTELRQSISGEDLINSRFTVEQNKLDLQIGDFVEFKDSVYTVLDEPQVKKAQNSFSYVIEFKSDQYILKNVQLLNPDTEETEFFLFGNAIDMVSLIISNMNRVYTDGAYYADFVEIAEPKNIGFNNENCLAALQKIATEFGCEFTVKGKKITLRKKIGKETNLTFEYKKELREITRQSLPNAELLTVLYARGSERNITNEYGSKRLKIPKIENNVDIFGTIERSVTFEDIYPRLNGQVSAVYDDIYAFGDTAIDFDVNNQLMGGIKAKVVFNTGDLAGREFEIYRYTHSTKKVELVPYTDDADLELPSEIFRPRVGDEYVFVGIKMPQAYIDNAEAELMEKATEYLEKYSQPNVIYKVEPHHPELRRKNMDLNLGDIVTLKDTDFGIEFKTRILKLSQKIHNPYEYKLDIGNQVTVSYFTQVMSDTKDIRNNIYMNDKYYMEQFNRVYNNVKGLTAPLYVNRGEFNPDNFYYNNQNRRDYVFRYDINGKKEWYFYIGQDHDRAEWVQANWQYIGDQFEILATQTILAENANIGHWLIQNGHIVSQANYNGNPRVHLNAVEGLIRLISGITVYSDSGYRDYTQTIELNSETGQISAHRSGDEYQEEALTTLSSNGVKADFAGQTVMTPPGYMVPTSQEIGKAAILGDATGKLSKIWLDFGFVAGVVGKAENTSNDPTPAYGGVFWDLKTYGRYVGIELVSIHITSHQIEKYAEFVSCYNNSFCEVKLPPNPIEGREIKIRRNVGEIIVSSSGNFMLRAVREDRVAIGLGDCWTFVWDGMYWLSNVQGRG